jgi:hypothetical protein
VTKRKSTKFGITLPEMDLDKPIPETIIGGGTVTKYCPTLGPRRCPYIKSTKKGIMKCTQYTEPLKKWQRDRCCYMYDTYNWEEDNID